ncbi:hypothetical protein EJ03DRAFT_82056 [Teratosphaeria nubilosa]|uniref:Uncharacterized protein n=1 Tax=Teratosphaeria nubilosa TaxID=161662 RepID=A0A6G1LAG9_9PEZI|nr:hypothetical protein EJ03DRAFT_82056 [Teratosphaeria nubilosa]
MRTRQNLGRRKLHRLCLRLRCLQAERLPALPHPLALHRTARHDPRTAFPLNPLTLRQIRLTLFNLHRTHNNLGSLRPHVIIPLPITSPTASRAQVHAVSQPCFPGNLHDIEASSVPLDAAESDRACVRDAPVALVLCAGESMEALSIVHDDVSGVRAVVVVQVMQHEPERVDSQRQHWARGDPSLDVVGVKEDFRVAVRWAHYAGSVTEAVEGAHLGILEVERDSRQAKLLEVRLRFVADVLAGLDQVQVRL